MNIKSISMCLLAALTVLSKASAQDHGACQPGLVLSLSPAIARAGETVPVWVNLISVPGQFYTWAIRLGYSTGVTPNMEDIQVVPPPNGIYRDYPKEFLRTSNDPSARSLTVAINFTAGGTSISTYGPAFEIPFTVDAASPAKDVALQITDGSTLDANLYCYYPEPTPGTIHVTGRGSRGDVDGDGKVGITDAQWAIKLLLGTATASPGVLQSADVWPDAGDGQVTLSDVVRLLQMAVGLAS
jgi:hypothetical protein